MGLLAVETRLTDEKTLQEVEGRHLESGAGVRGYEIHVGVTEGPDRARPYLELSGRSEGAVSADGKAAGCYLHGLFTSDAFRQGLLTTLGERVRSGLAYESMVEEALDALAGHLESHLEMDRILEIARGGEVARFPLPQPRQAPLKSPLETQRWGV